MGKGNDMTKLVPEVKEVFAKQLTSQTALTAESIFLEGLETRQLIVRVHDCWFVLDVTNYYEDLEIGLVTGYGTSAPQLRSLLKIGLLSNQAFDNQNVLNRKEQLERERADKRGRQKRLEEHDQREYERLKRKFEGGE